MWDALEIAGHKIALLRSNSSVQKDGYSRIAHILLFVENRCCF